MYRQQFLDRAVLDFSHHLVTICVALHANGESSYRDVSNIERLILEKCPSHIIHIITDSPGVVHLHSNSTVVHKVTNKSGFLNTLGLIFSQVPHMTSILFTISSHGYICHTNHQSYEATGLSEYILVGREKVFDFELSATVVQKVPPSCNLFCLLDTCHSGTLLDLHYTSTDAKHFQRTKYSYGPKVCKCIAVSACSDIETAGEDISEYGGWGGKLTCSFLDYAVTRQNINWFDWFDHTRVIFSNQARQHTQSTLSIL